MLKPMKLQELAPRFLRVSLNRYLDRLELQCEALDGIRRSIRSAVFRHRTKKCFEKLINMEWNRISRVVGALWFEL